MTKVVETDSIRLSQELAIFHDVAKALTSSLDLDCILQTIMEKMAEYFRPDTWSLLMVDEERQDLYFAIAVGTASEALKNVRLKVGGESPGMSPNMENAWSCRTLTRTRGLPNESMR
jgi:transcriptional regulator with GAF, ATPase, and Fis domain